MLLPLHAIVAMLFAAAPATTPAATRAATRAATLAAEEIVEHYPDGTVLARYQRDSNGRLHGRYVDYHPNGKMRTKTYFREGWMQGSYEAFHDNGERFVEASHERGLLEGTYRERFPDGTPRVVGEYVEGERHGTFEHARGGKVVAVQEWAADELVLLNGVAPYPRPLDEIAATLARIYDESDEIPTLGELPRGREAAPADPELEAARAAAVRRLRAYRSLCGVPWDDLVLDASYGYYAQAGARLLAVIGRIEHTPKNPGLPADEYRDGYTGTSNSNLASGSTLVDSIDQYMDDSDPTNIDRVGHRRWCLNPPMQRTGFGIVGRISAMWALDRGRSSVPPWSTIRYPPAGYVPTEYFGPRHAWSVRLSTDAFGIPKVGALEIVVVRLDDELVPQGAPLELDYLGVSGEQVIFRPVGVDVAPGSRYWVELGGVVPRGEDDPVRYLVEFVELPEAPER